MRTCKQTSCHTPSQDYVNQAKPGKQNQTDFVLYIITEQTKAKQSKA